MPYTFLLLLRCCCSSTSRASCCHCCSRSARPCVSFRPFPLLLHAKELLHLPLLLNNYGLLLQVLSKLPTNLLLLLNQENGLRLLLQLLLLQKRLLERVELRLLLLQRLVLLELLLLFEALLLLEALLLVDWLLQLLECLLLRQVGLIVLLSVCSSRKCTVLLTAEGSRLLDQLLLQQAAGTSSSGSQRVQQHLLMTLLAVHLLTFLCCHRYTCMLCIAAEEALHV